VADGDFRMYRDPAGQVWLNAEDVLEVTRDRANTYAEKANESDDALVQECYGTTCRDLRMWSDLLEAQIIGAVSGL
jgi:hypothetical protein